jgi:toxin ParE1/3/4
MDFKIIWSPRGLESLQQVIEYIARDNPDAARRIGEAILNKSKLLQAHPQLGRQFEPLNTEDVREIQVRPYRIIYRVHVRRRQITILTVWHGARQEPEL